MSEAKVLVVGAGAIGATVAAWLVGEGIDVTVMDVGETADALRKTGITTYEIGNPDSTRRTVKVPVVRRPGECPDADIIVLAVKNYDLRDAAQLVLGDLGSGKIIVSLANGWENQEILPRFFSRVIYCVVGYNARRDDAVVVGYQKKGPLLIGTPDNSLGEELNLARQTLGRGCSTQIVDRLQDAVHTKIVMNLTNALDALVGHGYQPLSSFPVYQHLLAQTLWEGVRVVTAAGYHEHKISGMPSFSIIRVSALLPGWLTRPIVRRRLRAMVMASMTQDVMLRGALNTELESITGYLVKLAARVGVPVPYNETIYALGQKHFHPGFAPLRCEDVLRAVEATKAQKNGIAINRRPAPSGSSQLEGQKAVPNGAQALLRTLLDAGVNVCFTNPGTSEMHFVAALDREPEMRAVLTLFEGVATGAADGYARMSGKPAATLLHLGCGLGNGLANLHNARKAKVPVVNIIGDHATFHVGFDAPLQSDIQTVARNVSGWVRTSQSVQTLCRDAAEAVTAAKGPPGQVATLILPADVSWSTVGVPASPPVIEPPAAVKAEIVAGVAEVLLAGGRSAILLGGRALREPALVAAARIAAKTGAKLLAEVFPTRLERGAGLPPVERIAYLPELASVQMAGLKNLVLVDARAPVAFFAYPGKKSYLVPEGCKVHELGRPAEDVIGALSALERKLGAELATAVLQPPRRPGSPRGKLTAEKVCKAVGHLLPENAIIVDEAQTSGTTLPLFTAGAPRHDVLTLTGGAIGQGLPMAVGAAVACADRPVIALVGDGSAMYTIQALWTMAHEKLNVVSIVFNNGAYAILDLELERVGVETSGPRAKAQFNLTGPRLDFVQVARGMGVDAVRVTTAEEFSQALERALAVPGPHLIDALVPSAFSGLKLKAISRILRLMGALPQPLARALKRKIAP